MIPDRQLIRRVLDQQDQRAYEQLVLRYQSSVRRWARRLCQGDCAAADDLAQETFIKAYTALAGFRDEARFSTWLYRIAFNLAASRWRQRREQWQQVEVPEASWDMANHEARTDVNEALAQLGEAQQLAIRLSLEEGFSHEEVAEVMGIPLGTVKTHILRGKQKLRVLLAAWNEVAQ